MVLSVASAMSQRRERTRWAGPNRAIVAGSGCLPDGSDSHPARLRPWLAIAFIIDQNGRDQISKRAYPGL